MKQPTHQILSKGVVLLSLLNGDVWVPNNSWGAYDCWARWKLNNKQNFPQLQVSTFLGVKRPKGGDGVPTVGWVGRISMSKWDGQGSEIECGAGKYCGKVSLELVSIMAEQHGCVGKAVVKQLWHPSCEAAYVFISKHVYSCTGGLLLVNLARWICEGNLTNSCRIRVFSSALTRSPGTYSQSELGRHQKRSWMCTFWQPPKETPAARAVKCPCLCFEFFLVQHMWLCAWHMREEASMWVVPR